MRSRQALDDRERHAESQSPMATQRPDIFGDEPN